MKKENRESRIAGNSELLKEWHEVKLKQEQVQVPRGTIKACDLLDWTNTYLAGRLCELAYSY